ALTAVGCGGHTTKGLIPGPARIEGLVLAPDGSWLGIGRGKAVTVWDLAKGAERARLPELAGGVSCLALPRDGKRLAVGSADKTLKVMAPDSGKDPLECTGHTGPLRCLSFNGDGTVLFA